MASLHPSEIESYATDSVASSPRSDAHHPDHARVRFMCSFGGKIVPRPHDNQLRYVGGDTRIVAVPRAATYASLLAKLSKLAGTSNVAVKYQLPSEDLDALISVSTDEDVENMMDEYDRVAQNQNPRATRLRLFLFPKDDDFNSPQTAAIATLLQTSAANRDHWFIDALNSGGGNNGPPLERNRSEASSIVSEVPDYLFGLDNSDESQSKFKTRPVFHDAVSVSDPGSPATILPPQFSSIPNLPPVKTRPEQGISDSIPMQASPVLHHYVPPQPQQITAAQAVHHPMPVYYVQQGPQHHHPMQHAPVQYMPVQYPYGQPVQGMYGRPAVAAVDPRDASPRVVSLPEHHVMYGVRSSGGQPLVSGFPGMVVAASGGEELRGSGPEGKTGNFTHS